MRPWFRRVALVAFIVLVPIALHTAWDHYEARRLARLVSDIRARNELVGSASTIPAAESPDNAARYYAAAAALVDARDIYGVPGLAHKMSYAPEAERSKVVLYQNDDAGWEYPQAVAKQLGWDAKQIQIRRKPAGR